jgi:CHAD domain-containing protein
MRGEHNGVHQARVATRRLREAVPVLTAGVKGGGKTARAKRKIRRLTRALGVVRELDVTMRILDELARRPGIPRNALEDVRAHVLSERDERRKVMFERLETVNTQKLVRRLHSVVASLTEGDADAWRHTLSVRILKRAKRFSAAVLEAGHIYAPERLHQVRIAVKKLRYALELADDGGVGAAHPLVGELKRAQETLGRLHDLQVLQHHVGEVQSNPPVRREGSADGLDAISQALEAECRHLHGRYLAAQHALLEAGEQCRSVVAPQLAQAVESRPNALKMALPVQRQKASARRA